MALITSKRHFPVFSFLLHLNRQLFVLCNGHQALTSHSYQRYVLLRLCLFVL